MHFARFPLTLAAAVALTVALPPPLPSAKPLYASVSIAAAPAVAPSPTLPSAKTPVRIIAATPGNCGILHNWREDDTFYDDYYHTTDNQTPTTWGDPWPDGEYEWYHEAESTYERENAENSFEDGWMADHYAGEIYLHEECEPS